MIYRHFELSQSLRGNTVIYIARNAAGVVVFRELSESSLKKAIDESIEEQQHLQELNRRRKAEKARAPKRGLFQAPEDVETEESEDPTSVGKPFPSPIQPRITRGPDGKFISKGQFEEPKKKSFWE